jgi:transcriptional regulator with XRE-family HTH domain
MTFGEFIKDSRIKRGVTLREFCRMMGWDASNWSKVERGVNSPPRSPKVLKKIADALGFPEKSDDRQTLIDLAAISFIPASLIDDRSVIQKLPVFFRTLRGDKPSREDLEALLKKIREG